MFNKVDRPVFTRQVDENGNFEIGEKPISDRDTRQVGGSIVRVEAAADYTDFTDLKPRNWCNPWQTLADATGFFHHADPSCRQKSRRHPK
jgi:hypothetical protein